MSGSPDPAADDPLPLLRTKLVIEGKTDQQAATELGVPVETIRALRQRHGRHLRLAAFSHRLGRYLSGEYPQTAFNALIQLLAVLMAFILGNAWQVRTGELSDLRSQLAVLRPLLAEVNLLHQKAIGLQRSPPQRCTIDFSLSSNPLVPAFPRWEAIRVSEGGLLLRQELFDTVRKSYDELSLSVCPCRASARPPCGFCATSSRAGRAPVGQSLVLHGMRSGRFCGGGFCSSVPLNSASVRCATPLCETSRTRVVGSD